MDGNATGTLAVQGLRDFSVRLAERLQSAQGEETSATHLAIEIGARNYVVNMHDARELMNLPSITRVPQTHAWFRGLANVRGRLVGVIDLEQLAGRPALPPESSRQLLVFGEGLRMNAGLLISRAFGLRNVATLKRAPQGTSDSPWESTVFLDVDQRPLAELDLQRLVAMREFQNIARGSAATSTLFAA